MPFLIDNEPLLRSIKLREKLDEIINGLHKYESSVVRETLDDDSLDFSDDVIHLSQKINSMLNCIPTEDLEISLGDFNLKQEKGANQ